MSYKCLDCGHIFDRGEESRWVEGHGERMSGCPLCHGDYEEATPCEICGSEHLKDELNGGVCDESIDKYRKNFNACYAVSNGETTEIEINFLLASLFDVSDIEQILKEYIRDKWHDVDCSPFIDNDISWFGERLAEEVKKNECKKK